MANELIKIRQFIYGQEIQNILQNNDIYNFTWKHYPINVITNGQTVFDIDNFHRDNYSIVKITVNGATYFESQDSNTPSFTISDEGHLVWTDSYELKTVDVVILEHITNQAYKEDIIIDDNPGYLYLMSGNCYLVVNQNNQSYPLRISVSDYRGALYYENAAGDRIFFEIQEDGTIQEIGD